MTSATVLSIGRRFEDRQANEFLAHLPDAEWALLEPHTSVVSMKLAEVLFSDNDHDDVVYFPLTCIVSMIAEMANGDQCEYGCIGREGMLGLQIALGAQALRGIALCQLAGDAVRVDGAVLRSLTQSNRAPELHRLLLRYAQATINVLAQSAACNALHGIAQRTARWLMQSRDRAGSETFGLTQEFLARMLGVRRASVTRAARRLRGDDIIAYDRGKIEVRDAAALAEQCCECYDLMRTEYAVVFN